MNEWRHGADTAVELLVEADAIDDQSDLPSATFNPEEMHMDICQQAVHEMIRLALSMPFCISFIYLGPFVQSDVAEKRRFSCMLQATHAAAGHRGATVLGFYSNLRYGTFPEDKDLISGEGEHTRNPAVATYRCL